jgi:hypothetical protein
MSKNNDNNKPDFPRIKFGADNIRSEVAKEFGIDGERKNVSSQNGVSKNERISAEGQMSGVPIYTKKGQDKKQ